MTYTVDLCVDLSILSLQGGPASPEDEPRRRRRRRKDDSPPPADQSFSAIDRLDTLIKGGGTLDRKDRTAGTLERKEKRVNGEAHGASAVDVNLKGNKRHYMY